MSITTNIDWVRKSQSLTPQVRNFIDGRWTPVHGAELLQKHSPRDGRLLVQFGSGDPKDVDQAVASAKVAYQDGRWSKMPSARRSDALKSLAALIEAHREELALLDCLDVGKPITEALTFDISAAAAAIRYSAEAADKLYGKVYGADQSSLSYELRRPMGVVAGIVGWNFPLVLAAGKIGPVLATGNCLILKPSELTSLASARLAELAIEAGIPAGVLNVIHGNGAIGALLAHHVDIDLITFTGSSATGKKLMIAAGESNMKRLVLECGGKAPNIVFEDCPDLDDVARAIVARAFWNQGQVCTASSRLIVQESILEDLLSRIIRETDALGLGDPLNPDTKLAALVSHGHAQKVLNYIDEGQREGARIAYQSQAVPPLEGGFYVAPTIFDQVKSKQRIAQEEIFGPVLSVMTFRDEAAAIGIANGTIYGLSAILWTQNLGRAHRMTQAISAGWIVVNATGNPQGGPRGGLSVGGHKQSGIGVEGGLDGLEAYLSKTAVQVFI